MKRKVVLIIGIIICFSLGVFGFIQNKSNAPSNKENKEENKVKTYQPV